MKILITGTSGFLGRRMADYFSLTDTVLSPSSSQLDIRDADGTARYFDEHRPDAVIHCAAVSDVGACERDPVGSRRINVDGSVNIARAAESVGAKCVMCSSDQVYFGSDLPTPHREDEHLIPANEYGRQKLAAESLCLDVAPGCVLLRLSWMYDTVRLSEKEHGNFITKFLEDIRCGNTLTYPIYDKRGITDAREVVKNVIPMLNAPGGVYNFGASNELSTYDTVCKVISSLDLQAKPVIVPNTTAFADRARNLTMDITKAESVGACFRSTAEGLSSALAKISIPE